MHVTSPRYRLTLLLFAGGVLVSAALVASLIGDDRLADPAPTTAMPDAPSAATPWSGEEPVEEDGKGKLLGHVERNGQLLEVREAVSEEAIPELSEVEANADIGLDPELSDTGPETTQR